jgi:predicted 3-demethylubiquinone-9 3-methyltransferase (glyoxalase superfamily)
MIPRIQPCLWYDGDAEAAARFYADTFPDSRIDVVRRAPGDYPAGKQGDVLTVEMTLLGRPFLLLNGGPEFSFTEAVSFQIATEDQDETDHFWHAITRGGGQESQCGWCKDRFGLSWQVTPKRLIEYIAQGGDTARRAFAAMMQMQKIDIAALERAVEGGPGA